MESSAKRLALSGPPLTRPSRRLPIGRNGLKVAAKFGRSAAFYLPDNGSPVSRMPACFPILIHTRGPKGAARLKPGAGSPDRPRVTHATRSKLANPVTTSFQDGAHHSIPMVTTGSMPQVAVALAAPESINQQEPIHDGS